MNIANNRISIINKRNILFKSAFFKKKLLGLLFLLPALIFFAVLVWYPILLGFELAFQRIDNFLKPPVWVGLQNFKIIFSDSDFFKSILTAAKFTLIGLICFPIPLIMAIVINEFKGFKKMFRIIFYVPSLFPAVAIYALWAYFFTQGDGAINIILNHLGLPSQPWFGDKNLVFVSFVIMGTWSGTGGGILFYSAALEGVNAELYEAAEIDGAGWVRKVWNITLPEIEHILTLLVLMAIIGSMQIFDMPFIMTGGGPNNATLTPVMYIYNNAFLYLNFGVASAMAVILFVVLIGFSILYLIRSKANKY